MDVTLDRPHPAGARRWRFSFVLALAMALIVGYAFSHTLGPRLLHPARTPPRILWFHAAVAFTWVLLFTAQAALVQARQVRLHRTLGIAGVALGAAIPPLGIATALEMARFKAALGPEARASAEAFLAIPLNDMLCFTAAFVLAVWWRRRPALHRRLILVAAACMMAAAFARLPFRPVQALRWYAGPDLLLAAAALRDRHVEGRVHAVFRVGLPSLVALQTLTMALFLTRPGLWMRFAAALVGG